MNEKNRFIVEVVVALIVIFFFFQEIKSGAFSNLAGAGAGGAGGAGTGAGGAGGGCGCNGTPMKVCDDGCGCGGSTGVVAPAQPATVGSFESLGEISPGPAPSTNYATLEGSAGLGGATFAQSFFQ